MGSSSVTGLETIGFFDNMSFDGTPRAGAMTTDGQLWIGSATAPHVRLGSLGTNGTVGIAVGAGTITLSVPAGGGLTLGAFGSTPNANGLSLTSGVLNMQPADATHPGGVSITTQSVLGAKTFLTSVSSPLYTSSGALLVTSATASGTAVGGSVTVTGGSSSGSDQAAANTTITNPKGTGTGAVGKILLQADAAGGTTGSTVHTSVNRLILNGSVVGMTSAAASTIATVTNASNSMAGGILSYSIEASDGTDFQVISGQIAFSLVNKATVVTSNILNLGGEASAVSTGTLVAVFSFSGASLQVTPTTSLTPTTLRITYSIMSNSQQAISVP